MLRLHHAIRLGNQRILSTSSTRRPLVTLFLSSPTRFQQITPAQTPTRRLLSASGAARRKRKKQKNKDQNWLSGEQNKQQNNPHKSQRKNKGKQKDLQKKKKSSEIGPENWRFWTHDEHGRLCMTEERAKSVRELFPQITPDNSVKNIVNNTRHKMMFRQRMTHDVKGPKKDQMYFCNTITTLDRSLLSDVPPSATVLKDGDSSFVELLTTGVARSKKQAESLAALDLMLYLRDCGVDMRDPPNLKALHKAREKERFQADLQQAQMILELCGVSKPVFDTFSSLNNTSQATVNLFARGQALTASAVGRSKAEAEGKALIEAAGKPLEIIFGAGRVEHLKALIGRSPAGHMTALHVRPLPDSESMDFLVDCVGDHLEHTERMKEHAEQKAKFQAKFKPQATPKNAPRKRNLVDSNYEKINAMFVQEEMARLRKAEDEPEGKYGRMKNIRDALPIKAIQNELLNALRTDQVVVVSGGTGSGKSTQCPQYILEDAIAQGKGAETRIVVTQPRRIAAISVAERVAAERSEKIGRSVGYTVRFSREPPRNVGGSIEFVTTGVLLRRLVNDQTLEGVSHVMIDEVHERDIDTDFLLVLLKELLVRKPDLRVVLMSATLNAESFGTYFSENKDREGNRTDSGPVPVMSVPAKPRHPVEVIHLEDLAGEGQSSLADEEDVRLRTATSDDSFSGELQNLANSLLEAHDQQLQLELEESDAEEVAAARLEARSVAEDQGEILDSDSSDDSDDEDEADVSFTDSSDRPRTRIETLRRAVSMRNTATGNISGDSFIGSRTPTGKREIGDLTIAIVAKIAQHVTEMETDAGRKGSILCFLPGWDEIKAATAILEASTPDLKSKMIILPLHSTIPQEDQHKVFDPADDGTVKVILATNIAESSVTIDDVLAVVDSGLVRELDYDPQSAMATMQTVPTSRASATQRLGRAGRVAPGKCYRLYSRGAMEAMLERPLPEILRTALEATCLQTSSMTSEGVANFLSRAIDPPSEEAVSLAMDRLIKLGAIHVSPGHEELTPLGRVLSRLPLDPAIGKMLIMGSVMKCLDPILTAAACFSSRDLFYTPPQMRDEARKIRQSFCDSSDLMATVNAYNDLQMIIREQGWAEAREWASDNFISLAAMKSIRSVRGQLVNDLNRIGLVSNDDLMRHRRGSKELREDASVNQNADNTLLYRAIWATGLPGNLSARRRLGNFGTLRTRMEEHAGVHPSSVAFYRKPPKGVKLPGWFLYHEMVLSSQVFLRGCTALEPEQIVLFGGYSLENQSGTNVSTAPKQQGGLGTMMNEWISVEGPDPYSLVDDQEHSIQDRVATLDDWIMVTGKSEDIGILSRARQEVHAALEMKVMDPRKPLPESSQYVIDAVCNVLEDLGESE